MGKKGWEEREEGEWKHKCWRGEGKAGEEGGMGGDRNGEGTWCIRTPMLVFDVSQKRRTEKQKQRRVRKLQEAEKKWRNGLIDEWRRLKVRHREEDAFQDQSVSGINFIVEGKIVCVFKKKKKVWPKWVILSLQTMYGETQSDFGSAVKVQEWQFTPNKEVYTHSPSLPAFHHYFFFVSFFLHPKLQFWNASFL